MIKNNTKCISDSRLSPYIKLCKGNREEAICVYTCLQHRASLYFTIIQEIEIAFRNELSDKIEKWLKTDPYSPNVSLYEYFTKPIYMASYLNNTGNAQLTKAIVDVNRNYAKKFKQVKQKSIKKAQKKGLPIPTDQEIQLQIKAPDHNDIISHLTFGFWVHLLDEDPQNNPHYLPYWKPIFSDLFENRFPTNRDLFTRMQDVLRFRNNLYHQEAVWKNDGIKTPEKALQNLEKKFNNFIRYLQLISPQRYVVVNESYNINQIKEKLFDKTKFSSEIQSLREILINS